MKNQQSINPLVLTNEIKQKLITVVAWKPLPVLLPVGPVTGVKKTVQAA